MHEKLGDLVDGVRIKGDLYIISKKETSRNYRTSGDC